MNSMVMTADPQIFSVDVDRNDDRCMRFQFFFLLSLYVNILYVLIYWGTR